MITVKVTTEMTFDNIYEKAWGGAIRILFNVRKAGKEEELMDLLVDWAGNGQVTITNINDFLWFNDGYIYDCLGMDMEEDEE